MGNAMAARCSAECCQIKPAHVDKVHLHYRVVQGYIGVMDSVKTTL